MRRILSVLFMAVALAGVLALSPSSDLAEGPPEIRPGDDGRSAVLPRAPAGERPVLPGSRARPAPGAAQLVGPARVIDGDTLEVAGQRIRIHGIDAPERDQFCRHSAGGTWACGSWSTDMARRLLAGREISCRDLGERTYNRVVAQCFTGEGHDVAELLIEAGVARACPRYANRHAHARGYEQLEAEVLRAGRHGIFAHPPPERAGFCQTEAERRADAGASAAECAIKGNTSSGGRIYHVPGSRHYTRTNVRPDLGQRWFCSIEEAEAAGWRAPRG